MRGAGLRLNNDVRRLWRCPACGAERKVGAFVTTVSCQCAERPAMKLIEMMRHERPLKELASNYLEFEFEPGELAPPRPRQEEVTPPLNSDTKLDFEMPASRPPDTQAGEGETRSQEVAQRPTPSQRPPRQNERRGDRGPRSERGPQTRQENRPDNRPRREESGPRDQQPRREQRGPQSPRPETAAGETTAPSNATPGTHPARKRNRNRRGNRPENSLPPGDNSNSSFGEGIPDHPPAPTQD